MSEQVREDQSQSQRSRRRRPAGGPQPAQDCNQTDAELPEQCPGVRRLSSPAMMADLLGVPPAAIRHWIRTGLLDVVERSGSLEWLDFSQLVVGRRLAALLAAGLSLREIDAQLSGLLKAAGPAATVAEGRMVVDGRRLSIARDGLLLGAGGQLHLSFYAEVVESSPVAADEPEDSGILVFEHRQGKLVRPGMAEEEVGRALPGGDIVTEILDLADDLEAAGEYVEAAEALRAVLQAQGPTADVTFMLAELLYRAGDLTAARERYYATIELDPEHLRARASLGCVLAELEEPELALAALEGVLRQEPEYADAHWHMAGVLGELGREAEARRHLQRFVALAPQSPWVDVARHRLEDA
jgi:tetratricopeptide (TPR) repeat protein